MTRYCIIGAGAAGLATLKTMLDRGHEVDCFEADDRVGGHWNTDYEALHLITSGRVTGFADFPMPDDWPLFPKRELVAEYFNAFADAFGLRERITFSTRVEKVEPLPADGPTGSAGWRVTIAGGEQRDYDGILVANGHLRDPKIPRFAGEYEGTQVHSGRYRNVDDITGERVLVVGSGNSGCDLAVDAAQHRYDTTIVIRQGHFFQPKTFFGKPRSELGFLSEFSFEEQDLITRLMMKVSVGEWGDYPGLPEPPTRTLWEGAPVVNNLLLYWIQHGRVAVKPGIEGFDGLTVRFADGSSGEYDTILWATGFHASLPFLDERLLTRSRGVPLRVGGGIVPVGLEKLYLIGLTAPRGPQPPVYPIQAELACEMIALHEASADGFVPVAQSLALEQEADDRIDMVRPVWTEQIEDTTARLRALAGMEQVA